MASTAAARFLRAVQRRPPSLAPTLTTRAPSLLLLAGGVVSLPVAASMREMLPARPMHSHAAAAASTAILDPDLVGFAHSGALWTATERR